MATQTEHEKLTRALSIRQPYVEMIFRGRKKAEYRSRPTNIRERVYIYASLKGGEQDFGVKAGLTLDAQDALPRGEIIGSVEVVGCEWRKSMECYAWLLVNPRRYSQGLRFSGQPQPAFWRPRILTLA